VELHLSFLAAFQEEATYFGACVKDAEVSHRLYGSRLSDSRPRTLPDSMLVGTSRRCALREVTPAHCHRGAGELITAVSVRKEQFQHWQAVSVYSITACSRDLCGIVAIGSLDAPIQGPGAWCCV